MAQSYFGADFNWKSGTRVQHTWHIYFISHLIDYFLADTQTKTSSSRIYVFVLL